MIGKRSWMMFSVVMIIPVLSGCSQAMMDSFFAVSHQEAKNMHLITGKKIDDHDKNMSEQHKKMHPDSAEAIDILRLEYETKSAALQKELEDMRSKVGENVKELIAMGLKLAGLPADSTVENYISNAVASGTKDATDVSAKDILAGLLAAGAGTAGGGLLGRKKQA